MDFSDDPEQAAFRTQLRAWASDRTATSVGSAWDSGSSADRAAALTVWFGELAEAGYVGVSFPNEYGGGGRSPVYEAILNEELGAAGTLPSPPVGHIGHAILEYGSARQKSELLPGLLSCRELWCQGFSEPGAGSDLASLTTRAVQVRPPRDAEGASAQPDERVSNPVEYRVDGRKIWTSGASWSRYCLLLARTDPTVGKHRGLSMFVLPMDTPGIDVRPITMADGGQDFTELFLDDVRLQADALVGRPGQGWEIAMHMLAYERGPADMGWVGRFGRSITRAQERIRSGELQADAVTRNRLARAWVGYRVLQLHVARSLSEREGPHDSSAAGSVAKLLTTRVDQTLHHALVDLLGAGFVLDGAEELTPYLWSRAQSVFGGTQQIQWTVVAQRVLGMPR